MKRLARISKCKQYRYTLTRIWDPRKPKLVFVMLNPSIADNRKDDPTIRRCIGYAKKFGYGSIVVVNLFAYRATKCKRLSEVADPVGRCNDRYILREAAGNTVVCAWGDRQKFKKLSLAGRPAKVLRLLNSVGAQIKCLKLTERQDPSHPVRLPKDLCLQDYPGHQRTSASPSTATRRFSTTTKTLC